MNNKDENKKSSIINADRPYAGLFPFREEDKDYFFGRDEEIKELVKLIDYNVLTVVFGKSGVGKTSLLRAGLIPWFRSNYYLPIYLRVNFNNRGHAPINQVKETIEKKIKKLDPQAPSFEDKTLWEYFSQINILDDMVTPILVFDQFEEIFHTEEKNSALVDSLVTEIADLIEDHVPIVVQERLKKEKRNLDHSHRGLNLRVIFSLREDYLAQLETLSRYIPSIKSSRYRVSQMKGIDAVEAVMKPAEKKQIIKSQEVAKEIIKKIPGARDVDYKPYETIDTSWETRKIEPFLLSLFCYQANEKRLRKKELEISMELIQGMRTEDIIHDYYEENILDFKPHVKTALEDFLLTPGGNRKLQEKSSLIVKGKVTDKDIKDLVDRRIIRQETRTGIDYIELIHDVLAPILKESLDKRKEDEKKRVEEEKRKKEAARKKKRNHRIIAVITALVVIIISGLTVIALYQKTEAKKQQQIAAEEKQRAEKEKQRAEEENQMKLSYEWAAYSIDLLKKDRDLSFRLAEKAYNTQTDNVVARRALLNVFYEGGFFRELFKDKFSEISKITSEKKYFFADFSPGGRKILIVTPKKARLFNLDGTPTDFKIDLPGDRLEFRPNSDFSPDGKYIAFRTESDQQIMLWNLSKNELKPLTLEGEVNSVAYSPVRNSKLMITASQDKKIRLFDLTGRLIKTFQKHPDHVKYASFSPDGSLVVSVGWYNTVYLWDLEGNQIGKPFKYNTEGINRVSFSPDGQRVVTAGMDGSVRLWDLNTNKGVKLVEHQKEATCAVFSPDGKYILTGGSNGTVRLFTLNNFQLMEFKEIKDSINNLSFSPDGKYILIAPEYGPVQLRPVDPEEIISIVNQKGNVRQMTEAEKITYNLPQNKQVLTPDVIK